MKFSVRRGYYGIVAENNVPTAKQDYELQITTMKRDGGGIFTSFTAGKIERGIFSFMVCGDFRTSIKHEAKRATEKTIVDCHNAALKQLDAVVAKFNAFYKIEPVPAFS